MSLIRLLSLLCVLAYNNVATGSMHLTELERSPMLQDSEGVPCNV